MTLIYLESLDARRKKVFSGLNFLKNKGVLAGGTALMLQINHRHSFDFDIFFDKPDVENYVPQLTSIIDIKERRTNLPNHQTFFTKDNVQITLFYYQFKNLYPKIKTESLPLFDKKDIAADKAYTVGRRPAWRDYVDLFFLLKEKHVSLKKIMAMAKQKFKGLFDIKLFLEQLSYFSDIRNFETEYVDKNYSPLEIQNYLKNEVRQELKKYFPK